MNSQASYAAAKYGAGRHRPTPFVWLFLGKVVLLAVTVVVVWLLYADMQAYHLEWLGWFYSLLTPLTNGLYALVERLFTGDTRYKIRAAITDDLGQRSLFLLLLTATVELTLYSLFKAIKGLVGHVRALREA